MAKVTKILGGIVAIFLAAVLIAVIVAKPAPDHPWFREDDPKPLVIAHQGGERLWPSNTMYAFEHAADLRVDILEMDIHLTVDGEIVVIHDDTVDRTTDGTGAVKEMTLEDIKALDAGYYWTVDGGQTYPYRGQGITIAALREVFTAFHDIRMNIEIKQKEPSMVQDFCDLLQEFNMKQKVLVASFHEEAMSEFRETCPGVATSTYTDEVVTFFVFKTLFLAPAYSPPAEAVQVPEYRSGLHVLTPRFVRAAQRRNMEVHAWTINTAEDMELMMDLGVDGIITDYPDMLLDMLNR